MFTPLLPGETRQHTSKSGSTYTIRNNDGNIDCNCSSWRNLGDKMKGPLGRTCKHCRAEFGDEAEAKRIGVGQAGTKSAEELAAEAGKGRKLRPDEKAALNGPKLQHALRIEDFPNLDPRGYLKSVKLDGVRALWDGKNFISREGNVYNAPAWFKAGLPSHRLDGELWMGRGTFQRCVGVVKGSSESPAWEEVTYVVYDSPDAGGGFSERLAAMQADHARCLAEGGRRIAWRVLEQEPCGTMAELRAELVAVVAAGDEGLMIRKADAPYTIGKSDVILKVKLWDDAEATVIGYTAGKGANAGLTGAIKLQMPCGKKFNINAVTAKLRREPPAIGTTVTYKFMGLTDAGLPKGAGLLHEDL